jgi:nitrogen fixation protein FixH
MTEQDVAQARSSWRWFPLGLVGALLTVFAVNGGMIYAAVHTFPGSAGEDGFDLSNQYDRVLADTARQASLGWQVRMELGAGPHLLLALTDRNGKALDAARIEAQAERPVGPPSTTKLALRQVADGRFTSQEALAPGQWTVTVSIIRNGQVLNATERLVAR